jgi:pimeloyl-ACP methyl ester carboxylesterase
LPDLNNRSYQLTPYKKEKTMPQTTQIYYYLFEGAEGDLPPVILIHGAGGNHLYWPAEIRRLPGWRVIAIDLPGHGKSEGRGQQTIASYAEQVIHWMKTMSLAKAVFIGHSMGSAIVLHLAVYNPEYVRAIGLVGGGAWLRVHPDFLAYTANLATFQKAVDMIINRSFCEESNPSIKQLAAKRMLEIRPSVMHGDLLACDAFDLTEEVGKIHQPALVVCGADDKMTPLRYSQYLADSIPNARLAVIPGAGHMVMLEKPQEVAREIDQFLSGL